MKIKKNGTNGAESTKVNGFTALPTPHDTDPVTLDGRPVEPGDELLIQQDQRPAAPVRVVYVGPRRAWIRVAVDVIGGRAPVAEFLLQPGTMVKRME